MKNKDVRVGMKVVPHDKTAGFLKFEDSIVWKSAKKSRQPFLFVRKDSKNGYWKLSDTLDGSDCDYFHAEDFEPYVEPVSDNVHVEDRIIYGRIHTQGLTYDLLELEPQKHMADLLPFRLRESVQVFLVADTDGKAFPLYVSTWSGYVIVPSTPEIKSIKFEIVEEDSATILQD